MKETIIKMLLVFMLFSLVMGLDKISVYSDFKKMSQEYEDHFFFVFVKHPESPTFNLLIEKELAKASKRMLPDAKVKIVSLDVTQDTQFDFFVDHMVYEIPVFLIVRGSMSRTYFGKRTADAFYDYISSLVLKHRIQLIDSAEKKQNLNSLNTVRIVGFFEDTNTVQYQIFDGLAQFFNRDIDFYLITDPKYAKSLKLNEQNRIAILKPNERPVLFDSIDEDSFTVKAIFQWIEKNRNLRVNILGPMNYQLALKKKNIALFLKDFESELSQKLINIFTNLAKEYEKSDDMKFILIKESEHRELIDEVAIEKSDIPAMMIYDPEKRKEYLYPKLTDSLTSFDVKKWIDSYVAGKVTPYNPELHEFNKDSIINLYSVETYYSAANWDKVLDTTKDVFVLFYQNRCVYCRVVSPHFRALSKIFKDTNIMLAAFNTHESVPPTHLNVDKIPMFYYFPANAKNEPILYNEPDRAMHSLFKFVLKKQTVLTPEQVEKAKEIFEEVKNTVKYN